jgi:hypothetical protein
VRMVKPYQVAQSAAKAIIIGNSRSEMGIDPQNPCWPADARPGYNLSIPGSTVYRQVRYGQHAMVTGDRKLLVYGVDFLDFIDEQKNSPSTTTKAWNPSPEEFDKQLPYTLDGKPTSGYRRQSFADHFEALFSFDSLVASLTTLRAAGDVNASTRLSDGFNPARDYIPIVKTEGTHVLFDQKDAESAKMLTKHKWGVYTTGHTSPELEMLARLLQDAKAHHVKVVLYLNPYHVHLLELIDQAGLWPQLEEWKRAVVRIAAENGVDVVWDFTLYSLYTTEALPPKGQDIGHFLNWFWETGHYRKELGDVMLTEMFKNSCPATVGPSEGDFGVALTPDNLETSLAKARSQQAAFVAAHPDVTAYIAGLLRKTRN